MSGQADPASAASALWEIGRQREQVIRRAVRAASPGWYWWSTAVLAIAFTAAIESGSTVLLGIGLLMNVSMRRYYMSPSAGSGLLLSRMQG